MYCNTSPASSTVRKIPEALPSENKRPWSNTRTRAESDNQTQTLGLVLRTDADIRTSDRGVSLVAIQSLSLVQCFVTPWTAARQAPLSSTISGSLLRFTSIELVMLSNHLTLCCPHLLLPSIFSSIRVFSSESALHIRWPKYWSFSFSISPFSEYSGLISFKIDWFDLLAVYNIINITLHSLYSQTLL